MSNNEQNDEMGDLDIRFVQEKLKKEDPQHRELSYNPEDISLLGEEVCNLAKRLTAYSDTENHIIQGLLYKAYKGSYDLFVEAESAIADSYVESDDHTVTAEHLQNMVVLARELDKTGDPWLMKQAALLDEILLTIGANRAEVAAAKRSQDEEILRIKSLANKENDPYTSPKAAHDKFNQVAEAQKAIDKVKDYRPMEANLSTRTCPDHPGAQMGRIGESTYQCSLDKGIYNYENGYTTMKGNRVPGGDISNQTQGLHDRPNEFTSFDTRESRLNPN